jgi:uncharacterized membrane protein
MLHCDSSWQAGHTSVLLLIIGLALFFTPHLFREMAIRQAIIDAAPSVNAYKAIYRLVILAGLGLIIWGKSIAPFIMVWQPFYELRYLSLLLMLPAIIFIVASNLPMSVTKRTLHHPMLLGVAIWGLAHLWSNGDLASILLFGSFTCWSLIKTFALGKVGVVTENNSISSLLIWDVIATAAGGVVCLLIVAYHGQLFGVGVTF